MEHLSVLTCFILGIAAFVAGTIDTLAGGGGLIAVPALLMTGMNPVMALGTNKLQSAIGELSASLHFIKMKKVNYAVLKTGLVFTIIGSVLGTLLLQVIPSDKLKVMIPALLLAVLIYYIAGLRRHLDPASFNENLIPCNKRFFALGSVIGFYNGFFGPGTGSIWIVSLIKVFKLNLKNATMYAKPLNLAGNLSALSIFIAGGKINLLAAFLMGIGSFLGGKFGASMVIYKDIKWLKIIFLSLMIVSTVATVFKYWILPP